MSFFFGLADELVKLAQHPKRIVGISNKKNIHGETVKRELLYPTHPKSESGVGTLSGSGTSYRATPVFSYKKPGGKFKNSEVDKTRRYIISK